MSIARVLPARRMSMFSSIENGKPSDRAKSFPVPSGRIPMRGLCRVRATPLTTSFSVPSPPAATMYCRPARAACRLHFSASPLLFVIDTALGRNRFSSAKIRGASATDPAVGLKIMYGFTVEQRTQHNDCRSSNAPRNIPLFVSRIFATFVFSIMPEDTDQMTPHSDPRTGYRISDGPVVRLARSDPRLPNDLPEVVELPRVYGAPLLFAIARDPRTLFAYWNVDWSSVFENTAPVDRQVHLRVYRSDGGEETSTAVEPMVGNSYLTVSEPRESYRVEIGYYHPAAVWNSVATSDDVKMPPERAAENVDVDVATIPFHLSFQRLIDLFRVSNTDALSEIISRLQKRAVTDEDRALLTPEEWEILRAMNLSIDEMGAARRAFLDRESGAALRRRAEALLGFGASSSSRGFGGSSWS